MWGQMPSVFLAPHATGDIQARNRLLMVAYTLHKRGLCPHCGYPREVCRNQDRFSVRTEICHGKAAVELAEQDAQKSKEKPEPGLLNLPVYQPPVEL